MNGYIRDPWLKALVIIGTIAASVWVASQLWGLLIYLGDLLLILFLSWLISFVLSPLTDSLRSFGLPHGIAVSAVYVALLAFIAAAFILVVPPMADQINQLATQVSSLAVRSPGVIDWIVSLARNWGIAEPQLQTIYSNLIAQVQTLSLSLLRDVLGLATSVVTVAVASLLVLALSYYISLDGYKVKQTILGFLPATYRDEAEMIAQSIDRNFGAFLRGQAIVSVIYSLITALAVTLAGLDYKLTLSVFAGIAMFVPFIGGAAALVPPLFVAAFQNPGAFWWLLIALVVAQQLLFNLIVPRLFASVAGIHPILVLVALALGAKLAGLWGALFAVPVAGVVSALTSYFYSKVAGLRR
jgi:putative permease